MLYSGHLPIADTIYRNQSSQATVKLLYFEPISSGYLSIADTFFENKWCPLLSGFTVVLEIAFFDDYEVIAQQHKFGYTLNSAARSYQKTYSSVYTL